jgi:hypothetical protein
MTSPAGSKRKAPGQFALHQVAPFAKVLTRQHRDAARRDHAFAQALRQQTMYPDRIDALLVGRSWFSGKTCRKCGSARRRVRDCACYDCQLARRPLRLDNRNRAFPWPAKRSLGGWLSHLEAVRRERTGERTHFTAGQWDGVGVDTRWHGTATPTGGLSARCDAAVWSAPGYRRLAPSQFTPDHFGCEPLTCAFSCPDLRLMPPMDLFRLAERNPGLQALLTAAGW